MPRLVRRDLSGPIKIEPQDKPIFVCGCGLSQKFPFCDGTHKAACKDEAPDTLYIYGPGNRTVIETRADAPATDQPAGSGNGGTTGGAGAPPAVPVREGAAESEPPL